VSSLTSPEVVVVGAGISGLTCGVRLLESNFTVKIVAQRFSPDTTSDVAGAYWEPYKAYPWERVRRWAEESLSEFTLLSKIPETGVSITPVIIVLETAANPPEWTELVVCRRARAEELPAGFSCGYLVDVPKIETPIYMPYLIQRFIALGGKLEQVDSPLKVSEVCADDRIVINCTGCGAREFCADGEVFPIRGQIVRVAQPVSTKAILLLDRESDHILVVPRTSDCVLGGTAESGNWSTEPNLETASQIVSNCQRLLPELRSCKVLDHRVGLRPGRKEVRLELEKVSSSCAVVHNYGHGGAGFTLSWGCAAEVCNLIHEWTNSRSALIRSDIEKKT